MNSWKRYLVYLLYFLLTIPAVMMIFKFIEPKKLAAIFAASLFISCSLLVFWGEFKNRSYKSFTLWTATLFFLLFSAPMIIVRLMNYDMDFAEINFGPLSGPDFHKYSTYGFMFLLVAALLDYIRIKRQAAALVSK